MSSKHNNNLVSKRSSQVSVQIPEDNSPLLRHGSILNKQKCLKRHHSTPLSTAIHTNNLEEVREIIEDGYDVNYADTPECLIPLQVAVSLGLIEMCKYFITKGADINAQNGIDGATPLSIAIKNKNDDCAIFLLTCNADIFKDDNNGNTPLHVAAANNASDIINRLIEHCPEERKLEFINRKNRSKAGVKKHNGQTALHIATKAGFSDVFDLLLNNGSDIRDKDYCGCTVLHLAAQYGFYELCQKIIDKSNEVNFDVINCRNKEKCTALILAARNGHSKCCEPLKDSDINCTDRDGNTALHYAISSSFRDTVNYLLENNADPYKKNYDGETCFHKAAVLKDESVLRTILNHIESKNIPIRNPGFTKKGETVMHLAVRKENKAKMDLLVEYEIFKEEINTLNSKNTKFPFRTPFHLTIINGNHSAFKLLSENGADLLFRDGDGNLPLHLAAFNGQLSMLKMLLKGNLFRTINDKNSKKGYSPLHCAIYSSNPVSCISYLIAKQADVNQRDSKGYAPLMKAAQHGKNDAVKYLIKAGARKDIALEYDGNTAFHIAADKGCLNCCEIFVKSAVRMISKKNKNSQTPIDLAFIAKQDKTFCFLFESVSRLKPNKDPFSTKIQDEIQHSIHQYMHEAIKENRRDVQKAIIESSWWFSGFNSVLCQDNVCENFRYLVKNEPGLTCVALNNCVITNDDGETTYNFTLFEDIYYNLGLNPISIDPYKKKYPFNETTGKLDVKNVKEFENYKWARDHPLLMALDYEQSEILENHLVNKYLNHMWNSAKYLFLCLLLFEILSVISTAYSLMCSLEWIKGNSTSGPECKQDASLIIKTDFWYYSVITCLLIHIVLELNMVLKFTVYYLRPSTIMRSLRVCGLLIYSIPLNSCSFSASLGVKQTWQWQIGILTFLLSWFIMVNFLNELPIMSLFMPISRKFIGSFLRVLTYIMLIVTVFSILFHILIGEKAAFSSPFQSFMKTAVWILGDLGYDDTFLEEQEKVRFPIMTNLIFLLFVTFISGFVVNLVISQPSDHLDVFKNKAAILKITSKVLLILQLGAHFRTIRKHYCVGFLVSKPSQRKLSYKSIISPFLRWDSDVQFVEDKELTLKEEISEMKSVILHQNKELFDLKEQLKNLCKIINTNSQKNESEC